MKLRLLKFAPPEPTPLERFYTQLRALTGQWIGAEEVWEDPPSAEWTAVTAALGRLTRDTLGPERFRALAKEVTDFGESTDCLELLILPNGAFEGLGFKDLRHYVLGAATAITMRDHISEGLFALVYAPFERFIPAASLWRNVKSQ